MLRSLFPRRYYHPEIVALRRRIKEVRKEIKLNTVQLARLKSPSLSRPRRDADRRRLASYLSTGSIQTIPQHRFKSDLVRKKRLFWLLAIIAAAIIVVVLLQLF